MHRGTRQRKAVVAETDVAMLVKNLRRRLNLTQEQFAREVGVTYSTVNNWENGKRAPQPFLLRRLLQMKEELDQQERKPE